MTTFLVTGGSGFIGAAISRALLARGDDVVIFDRAESCPVAGARYIQGDITRPGDARAACEGVDAIIHNASLIHTKQNRQEQVWAVNLDGTRHMLEAGREHGIGRFVYVSSASVVYEGKDIENGDESLPYCSVSQAPYADSKVAAEKLVLEHNGAGDMATCALRPHVVFGPGDERFVPAVLANARSGRLRFQVGRGTWLSDYTYVENFVDAVLLAADALAERGLGRPPAGEAYFITNGEPIPFWDFVRELIDRLELPPIRYRVPGRLVYGIAAIREALDNLRGGTITPEDGLTRFAIRYMCTHHYFSIDKARRDLGYEPAISIKRGLELTCEHLRSTGAT